jgi:hypothetical protein
MIFPSGQIGMCNANFLILELRYELYKVSIKAYIKSAVEFEYTVWKLLME